MTLSRAIGSFVLALVLAGCGSGGDNGSDGRTEKPLTKAEFLARGDAICADAQAELAGIQARVQEAQRMPAPKQAAELEAIWRDQLELTERFTARFERLTPPRADEPRMREFMRSLHDGIRLSRQIVEALADRREPAGGLLREYGKAVYRGNVLAQEYGFDVCGRMNE